MSDRDKYVQQRAQDTRRKRTDVLRGLLKGDLLEIAPVEQTARRLDYQGRGEEARRLREAVGAGEEPPEELIGRVREALVGTDETQPVRFLDRGAGCARSIGRVVQTVGRKAKGTGFLVSPRLLLTNQHVLASELAAREHLVQFDYRERRNGGTSMPVEFRLQPELVFLSSDEGDLDYALVAVEAVNEEGQPLAELGFNPLIGRLGKSQQGARVNIVHHPEGDPKKVSIRQNFLALMLEKYVHYLTDTSHGSSGSPVFNDEWEVVALHHGAVEATDPKEIELFREIVGKTTDKPWLNEGVRVSRIVADLETQAPTLKPEGAGLFAAMLTAAKTAQPLVAGEASPAFVSTAAPLSHTVAHHGGGVTVTVHVSGAPAVAAPAPSRDLELYQHTLTGQKSLLRGLMYLEQARERPYLPEASERRRRREEYYGDLMQRIENDELNPAQLFDALSELQRSRLSIVEEFPAPLVQLESLARRLEANVVLEGGAAYARARAHLYTWCDLQEDRMLECIYTGAAIAPEQLMLKDIFSQLDLEAELPRNFKNDRILNCEHIVPQSWFGKKGDAVSDMHHLISARGSANNFRSDKAYRDLGQQGEAGPANRPAHIDMAGWRDGDEFEPKRKTSKPVIARATLYFLLTHPGEVAKAKYDGQIDLLRTWADSKPTRYELHRNEAIFEAQGNRNPLIDFPDWAGLVDFARGLA